MNARGRAAFLLPRIFLSLAVVLFPSLASAQRALIDTADAEGLLRTITLDQSPIDLNNPFFKPRGNGRSCATCHVGSAGWTITPDQIQMRFERTGGLDPLFRVNDGSHSPLASVRTIGQRRTAYNMLLSKGLIRIGLPIPAGADFKLVKVDDPYEFASARELSLFRRPLPATNLRFLTTVMWDGRESFGPLGTTPIRSDASLEANASALFSDLMHQANDAATGHSQAAPLSTDEAESIVRFELNLATAQQWGRKVGWLNNRGARGGAGYVAQQLFYVTINDALGADVLNHRFNPLAMLMYNAWAFSRNPHQTAIARGQALFNDERIDITGVAGLNDDLGIPVIRGACTTCHDAPNIGNHSVGLPIDIGVADASRRTSDLPLYTFREKATGALRETTDPARALLTGRWKDIGKFKGPILRGLAARPPYFHNGSAANLEAVVDFYTERFNITFTEREKADLVAFLKAL